VRKEQLRVSLSVACELTRDQMSALQNLLRGEALLTLMRHARPGRSDADPASAVRDLLARGGFRDVDVTVKAGAIDIRITAPPR
jgi:hypothetical protein